ncbi:MAG: aspartate-semialdehyde dehydrogenase [Phycisphaerales bacterium]|nr:aspartate-semialdehyde dehydrogenase [Phycisphaerales bacterium]
MSKHVSIAVAGATGAVGREMLEILEQRRFPHSSIRLLASERSAGQKIAYRGEMHAVQTLTHDALKGVDIALFSAGGSISKEFCRQAAGHGCTTVDNSSAFRMDRDIPLVVPEINPEALGPADARGMRAMKNADGTGRIIANPNCSTIILLMALTPLRNAFGVERVIVSTYQAASGAGAKGIDELEQLTRADLAGQEVRAKFFHEPYAFNLFSHNTAVDPQTGLNVEETKVIKETHKIWGDDTVGISATCIRVPVRRAHAESVNVTLKKPATTEQVRDALARFPGVSIVDDRAANRFPTPLKASGKDDCLVGRIRPDASRGKDPGAATLGFDLFVCGDQLRKGAALNAIQIAELLV